MSSLFHWLFNDFLGYGFSFLDKISFTINGVRFSLFHMILGTLVLAIAFMIFKRVFNIEFNLRVADSYRAGTPHITDTVVRTTNYNKKGEVTGDSLSRTRRVSNSQPVRLAKRGDKK